jgi:HlyD family secretion protein
MPGRIGAMMAREGDQVASGQILARVDDPQLAAKADQARAAAAAATARYEAAEAALALLKNEVRIQIAQADAGTAHAQASLDKALAAEHQAARDAGRFSSLASDGSIGRQAGEKAELAWTAARHDLSIARAALVVAEKNREQAALGDRRITARQAEVRATLAQRDQARAVLDEMNRLIDDLTIKAPAKGIITTRISHPGEVVAPGTPLYTLVDLDDLYLKVYVAEKDIGSVRLDLPARIYVDALPDRPFDGRVRFIAHQAEFTPKEVQTPDERVKLVYAVKIYLDDNPDHAVSPGIPADALIRWDEAVPWVRPRW